MTQDDSPWRKMFQYASVGSEFVVTFGLFLAGGLLLDYKMRTMPVFTLIGALLGFAVALYRLVKVARQAQRDLDENDKDRNPRS